MTIMVIRLTDGYIYIYNVCVYIYVYPLVKRMTVIVICVVKSTIYIYIIESSKAGDQDILGSNVIHSLQKKLQHCFIRITCFGFL